MSGNARFKPRGDTAANWSATNPVLAARELGIETDTGRLKFGDGATAWNALVYFVSSPRIQSVVSAATMTPTFNDDQVNVTAQAAALILANPTGTVIPGKRLLIRIRDNGTAQGITYGTQYRALGVTLPTTTVINKNLYLGLVFNSTDTKWDVLAVGQE